MPTRCALPTACPVAQKLQSDEEFAEVFARSKWRTSKWGPAKLEAELARRGVAREHVSSALSSVFGDEGLQLDAHLGDLQWQQGQGPGRAGAGSAASTSGSADLPGAGALSLNGPPDGGGTGGGAGAAGVLVAAARRQYEQSRGLKPETRRRRLVGWLHRRGHRWEDVSKIVKQLEKEAAAEALDGEGLADGI